MRVAYEIEIARDLWSRLRVLIKVKSCVTYEREIARAYEIEIVLD